ncbi:MAG: phosphoribosylglycinamide formyltransferase [Methanosarcinaceae archaeon]|nr:phosphoribosylglycinamide formyltransferase [Methanosarcinaceae archaeon]
MTVRISILVSGRGTNFQSIADAIKSKKIEGAKIVCLISNKKDAGALLKAKNENIPGIFVNPDDYNSREEFDFEIMKILESYETDLVVLAGYLRIISDPLIEKYKNRIINIHPSLLPSFKGLNAQRQAIEYGSKISGCTVHFVEPSLDSGPIIIQRTVPVFSDDDENTLAERILTEEHIAYPEAVRLFVEGKLKIDGRKVIIDEN